MLHIQSWVCFLPVPSRKLPNDFSLPPPCDRECTSYPSDHSQGVAPLAKGDQEHEGQLSGCTPLRFTQLKWLKIWTQ